VEGLGPEPAPPLITTPQALQQQHQQSISTATPQPAAGRVRRGGGGSDAEDEDAEGERSVVDQRRRRQQRRQRKEQGGDMTVPSPAPAPAPALAPATTDAGGDDVVGVAGAAAALPAVNRGKEMVTAISPVPPALPPVAPNLESMLQVARESLAAAVASGDARTDCFIMRIIPFFDEVVDDYY
jgi:hypothetical protein